MRITKIRLENFRQYRYLDLQFDPENSLTVIVGKNGVGKTNLLNSMSWCLYGEENKRKAYNSEVLGIPNLLEAASTDGSVEVRVEMEMQFDDASQAFIRRSQSFMKNDSGGFASSPSALKVLVKTPGSGGFEEVEGTKFVDRRAPQKLESFFLFDGEKLDEYFQTSNADSVKLAVLQVAQIDILDRLILRLTNSRKTLLAQIPSGGEGSGVSVAQRELAGLEKEVAELNSARDRIHGEVNQAENEYSNIEETIRREGAEQEKFAKVKELVEEIGQLEARSQAEIEALAIEAAVIAPFALNKDIIEKFLEEIARRRERKELPSSIAPQTIQFVLEEQQCICGADLHSNKTAIEHLTHLLLQHEEVSKLGSALVSIEGSMLRLQLKANEFANAAAERIKGIASIHTILKEKSDEKVSLEKEIKSSGSSSAPEFLLQLRQTHSTIVDSRSRIARIESDIELKDKQIFDLENQIQKTLQKDEKSKTILSQISFAGECLEAAQSMRDEITKSTIQDVSEAFNRVYNELIWKEFEANASIDLDFNVRVEKDGQDHFGSLSSGEYECLAFAFSIGLGRVSNYELPMVIDTPLARLSQAVQEKVCETLGRVCVTTGTQLGQQVALLVTDTEYNSAVQAKLDLVGPAVFDIEFDVAENVSTIVRRK